LAHGYLDNVELTAEKFIKSPFGAGERLYRTGDLARWLPGGDLEFLGRLDHQVKIRGFRIELAEIEEQLTHFEPIKEAVVVSKTDPGGHKYLCAYLVAGPSMEEEKLEVEVLRDYLARKLPHYMIPAYFELLDKIPLTPNGKVDRKALPEPGAFRLTPTVTYVEPGSPLEKTVAAIWSAELGLERVGINDNFFDLGGNSLDVVKVNSRLREALGMNVPVVSQFRYRTVGSLAQYLNREAADGLVREDRTDALQRGERDKLRRLQMRKRRSL
jgi:tyrocidine synthetase-3